MPIFRGVTTFVTSVCNKYSYSGAKCQEESSILSNFLRMMAEALLHPFWERAAVDGADEACVKHEINDGRSAVAGELEMCGGSQGR